MKKLTSKGGFTLIEMLATLLILVFLVLGIGTGMDSALTIYDEARFESNSAAMANIVNTSLGDILRYSENLTTPGDEEFFVDSSNTKVPDVEFVFTNYEYAVRDAYFSLKNSSNTTDGILRMRNLRDGNVIELVNTGAYPDLKIGNFDITYLAKSTGDDGNPTGGYFTVNYKVFSEKDSNLTKDVQYIIRCMNPI